MLFKLTGSIIVIVSCSFLGLILSRDCKKRPTQLRELQGILQMFENQITYLSDIIADAFERISKIGGSDTCVFFTRAVEILRKNKAISASEGWSQAVEQCICRTALNKEDEEILMAFGRMLGSTDLDGQIKNIRLTIGQLRLQEDKAEESRRKNENMYKSLGVLGGIAVVIVLL
ncbi:MAG: stage III sporulation protein AB [Clostridiaceae bacterium]|jgi:stage III sporulation protein AB|nr:stage III sporulation protein AB [Clostridiaceae bacterium]